MADANIVVTVDTASSPWVYPDGRSTTISGVAEDFVLRQLDLGATGIWDGGGMVDVNGCNSFLCY